MNPLGTHGVSTQGSLSSRARPSRTWPGLGLVPRESEPGLRGAGSDRDLPAAPLRSPGQSAGPGVTEAQLERVAGGPRAQLDGRAEARTGGLPDGGAEADLGQGLCRGCLHDHGRGLFLGSGAGGQGEENQESAHEDGAVSDGGPGAGPIGRSRPSLGPSPKETWISLRRGRLRAPTGVLWLRRRHSTMGLADPGRAPMP